MGLGCTTGATFSPRAMLMSRDAATLPIVRGALADYLRHRGKKVTALHTPEDWQARAACRGQSAAIFFAPTHFERKDREAPGNDRLRRSVPPVRSAKSA